MRILLIVDDPILGAAVRDQIAADWQSVDWVTRLDAAGDAMRGAAFDLGYSGNPNPIHPRPPPHRVRSVIDLRACAP
jgi:hypothetical protein